MKNEEIIDEQIVENFDSFLEDKGEILWKGNPNPKFSISILELGGTHDVISGPISALGFILAGTFYGVYHNISNGNYILAFLVFLIGSFILVLPDIIKNKRKQNTKYALSNKAIYFQLWRWGKVSYHFADYNEVQGFTYEEYDDGFGIIHVLPKKYFDFDTFDFISSKKRFYPTLEDIAEVKKVHENLVALNAKRK